MKNISRRQFIATSLGASAAFLLVPYIGKPNMLYGLYFTNPTHPLKSFKHLSVWKTPEEAIAHRLWVHKDCNLKENSFYGIFANYDEVDTYVDLSWSRVRRLYTDAPFFKLNLSTT